MSIARQQNGIFIHGDPVKAYPVHGGKIPTHGSPHTSVADGPVHGANNLDNQLPQ